jgi:hypothetical protein
VGKKEKDEPIDVFVSHSEADQPWVRDQLVPRLEQAGLTVAVGYQDFEIGTPRMENIEHAVQSSRHTLLVLTPDWIEGEWTALDSLFAGAFDPAARQRKLIPLLLKPCELPPRIQILTYADFTAPEERALQWERLIDALRPVETPGAVPPPDVPQAQPDFVNRERELDLLDVERLAASQSPYLLLNAPTGFGKTYLLKQVLQSIQEDRAKRARWTVRYIELVPAQRQDALSLIVQSITDQPAEGDVAALVERVCDHIVQELAASSEKERRAVLLVLDGIEQLSQAARQWLYSLLYRLYRRTRVGGKEAITVRILLAGHNVEQFWEECEQTCPMLPAPQRMDLGPLDQHAIEELIWNQARSVHTVLDDLTARQIAGHVWYLSGGHPKAIHSLVADLARRLFLVGPVQEYYAANQECLVRSCLLGVAKELLQNLDPQLRKAVQALSVLRRINANSVRALVRSGALPEGTNEIRLLGDLQRAHVLVGPSIAEPFYRDRFMRRIFVLDLAHRSRRSKARFRRLNAVALDLYAGWIRDAEPRLAETHLKSAQRLFAAVEWLYHALQDSRRPVENIQAEFQALVAVLSQDGQSAAQLIAVELRRDAQVGYLLRRRLGEEGVDVACRWLQKGNESLDPAHTEGGS